MDGHRQRSTREAEAGEVRQGGVPCVWLKLNPIGMDHPSKLASPRVCGVDEQSAITFAGGEKGSTNKGGLQTHCRPAAPGYGRHTFCRDSYILVASVTLSLSCLCRVTRTPLSSHANSEAWAVTKDVLWVEAHAPTGRGGWYVCLQTNKGRYRARDSSPFVRQQTWLG